MRQIYAGSSVRIVFTGGDAAGSSSHAGSPPKSYSASMNGPSRSSTGGHHPGDLLEIFPGSCVVVGWGFAHWTEIDGFYTKTDRFYTAADGMLK